MNNEEILKLTSNLWIVTATVCSDCGGDSELKIFDHKPSYNEIEEVGGRSGWCVSRKLFNLSNVDDQGIIEQEGEYDE